MCFHEFMVGHPGAAANRYFTIDRCQNIYPCGMAGATRRLLGLTSNASAASDKLSEQYVSAITILAISLMIDIRMRSDQYDSGKLIALVKTW
jgi:hypothetical protein